MGCNIDSMDVSAAKKAAYKKLIGDVKDPSAILATIQRVKEEEYGEIADGRTDAVVQAERAFTIALHKKSPKIGVTPITVLNVKAVSNGEYVVKYKYKDGTKEYTPTVNVNGEFTNDKGVAKEFSFGMVPLRRNLKQVRLGSEKKKVEDSEKEYLALEKDLNRDTAAMKKLAEKLEELSGTKTEEGHKNYLMSMFDLINPMFMPKMRMYLNTAADKTRGEVQLDSKKILLNVTKNPTIGNNEMGGLEMYVHEIFHALTGYAVESRDPKVRDTIRRIEQLQMIARKHTTWKIFMPEVSLDAKREEEIARARYEYVFNNKDGNGLHEFISHGLTNQRLMKVLKGIQATEPHKGKETLLDKLARYVKTILDIVLLDYNWDKSNKDSYTSLMELSFKLMESNNKALNRAKKDESLVAKAYAAIPNANKWSADKLKELGEWMVSKGFDEPPRNGSRFEYAKWMAKYSIRLLFDEDMKHFRTMVLAAFGAKPEGFLQNVIRDMGDPDKLQRSLEDLQNMSDAVDRDREHMVATVKKAVMEGFKTHPTKVQQEAMTIVALDTDLSSIYDEFKGKALADILSDPQKLEEVITKVKTRLARLDRENFNWNSSQSHGLGFYLATHVSGIAQNLNAENIAKGVLSSKKRGKPNKDVVAAIDTLSTLYGLKYTPQEAKNVFAEMVSKEPRGVANLMNIHKGFKNESKELLFNKNTYVIKGYTKELFDDSVSVLIKPASMEAEMRADGYDLVEVLEKNPMDTSKEKMAIYKSKLFVTQSYNRAATRLTSLSRKGTTLTSIRFSGNEQLARRQAERDKKRLDIKRKEAVEAMEKGEYTPVYEDNLSPVTNQMGEVLDYRYMMLKSRKKELLDQDIEAPEVLGRMMGSIIDKVGTKDQNKAVLAEIHADMKENYIPGLVYGKNNMEYIKIEENSPDEKVRELYKILPTNFKEAVSNSEGGYIAVRRDMYVDYFGFRNLSITDASWIMAFTPQEFKTIIRIIEKIWQEIISISKVDIIIRTPVVILGNILSNFMYSVQTGSSPLHVAKLQLQNLRNLKDYLNTSRELEELKVAKVSGNILKKDTSKIAMLQERLKRNPIHTLAEAGMLQTISEDMATKDTKSSNKLSQYADEKMEFLPEMVRDGIHWLYLSEKTSFFKFISQATQYSDLVARATEYQLLLEQGMNPEKAKKQVLDVFINYNKPATNVEQYLNDMGLVMFTKYFKRIQRTLRTTAKDKPVSLLLALLGQEFIFGDIADVTDQSLLSKNYGAILQNPMDHIMRAITPSAVEGVFSVLPTGGISIK